MILANKIQEAIAKKDATQYLPLKKEVDEEVARLAKSGQKNYGMHLNTLLAILKDETETFASIPETKLNRLALPKPTFPLGEVTRELV